MKKKLIISFAAIIVLALGTYSYKFYKDYQDFNTFRKLLDENYIPVIQESGAYFEKVESFNNDLELSDWRVDEGFDKNLELRKRLKEAQLEISKRNASYENTLRLKNNVLETIPILQDILEETYTDGINDDITPRIEILKLQIDEMNKILEEH